MQMNLKKTLLLVVFLSAAIYVNAQINLQFETDSTGSSASAIAVIPDSRGYVNDRERLFSEPQYKKLVNYMRSKKMDSTQVTILTIHSIKPFGSLEDLATSYANMWQLGSKKKNGVMIILSKELMQSRVHVGEGLEKKFTPSVLKSIDAAMVPEFVKGDYFAGVWKALQKIHHTLHSR